MDEKIAKAKKYLETILKSFQINAEISEVETQDGITLEVKGEDIGLLIGREGATLASVELIVSIAANKNEDEYTRIFVDAEGYKEKKKLKLEKTAIEAAEKVEKENEPVSLMPMTPYERRVVHLTLRENTSVSTESHGEEPERYITVKPL